MLKLNNILSCKIYIIWYGGFFWKRWAFFYHSIWNVTRNIGHVEEITWRPGNPLVDFRLGVCDSHRQAMVLRAGPSVNNWQLILYEPLTSWFWKDFNLKGDKRYKIRKWLILQYLSVQIQCSGIIQHFLNFQRISYFGVICWRSSVL